MTAWTVILAAGLGTLVLRVGVLLAADRIRIPSWLDRASTLVAPAALAALATTNIVDAATSQHGAGAVAPVVAAGAAAFAVARKGSAYVAMLVGMPVLGLTTALLSQ
jgi:branched-subunit amino acid transport protein